MRVGVKFVFGVSVIVGVGGRVRVGFGVRL